jgi:hypothetical protein
MSGQRFGRLVAISYAGKRANSKDRHIVLWNCKCDCGNETIVSQVNLSQGTTKSCGCLKREIHTLDEGVASFNSLYSIYTRAARDRDLQFELTKDEFRSITKKNCYYCGIPPYQIHRNQRCNGSYTYMGVDRTNCSLGYTMQNIRPCCKQCNYAKWDMSEQEFFSWLGRLGQRREHIENLLKGCQP